MRKLLSILILFFIISCNNSSVDVMDLAESLMDVQPDSALSLLKSVSEDNLSTREKKARFALLYSQALDKNRIFVKDDSLIRIAVEYYDNDGNSRNKMLSYFYWSSILYENKSYLQSLKTSLIAKKIAKIIGDYYYLGLINYNINDIYTRTHMLLEALTLTEETIEAFKLAGKEEHLDWAYFDKAKALCNLDSINQCRIILDSIYDVAKIKNTTELINSCNKLYMFICAKSNDIASKDSITYYFPKIKKPTAAEYICLIKYYLANNQLDSTKYYLDKINTFNTSYQDNLYDYVNAKFEFMSGEKDKAFDRINKTLVEFDSLYHSFSQMGLSAYLADFYREETRAAEEKTNRTRKILGLSMCMVSIFAIILFILHRKKIKRKEEELSLSLDVAANLRREIMNNKQLSDNMKTKIELLMKNQFDTLTSLCNTYYKMKAKNKAEIGMTKKVHEIIREFRYAENMNEIEEIVNQEQNNIISRLLADSKNNDISFSDREKSLLIYIISGFPATTTSILLEITLSNYYTLKSRLKNKIQAIDSVAAKEVFENYF